MAQIYNCYNGAKRHSFRQTAHARRATRAKLTQGRIVFKWDSEADLPNLVLESATNLFVVCRHERRTVGSGAADTLRSKSGFSACVCTACFPRALLLFWCP